VTAAAAMRCPRSLSPKPSSPPVQHVLGVVHLAVAHEMNEVGGHVPILEFGGLSPAENAEPRR